MTVAAATAEDVAVRRSVTSSGVQVVSESLPGVVSVSLGLWVQVGSRDELAHTSGASHLLEHLLFCGTRRRSGVELAALVEGLGGQWNALTTQEETCFYARCLGEDLPVVLEALCEMVTVPALSADALRVELPAVAGEFAESDADADRVLQAALLASRFPDHPLSRPVLGDRAQVLQMSVETVRAHYERHYRPGALVVSAAGAVDHDALVAWCDLMLGDMGRPGREPLRRTPPPQAGDDVVLVRHGGADASGEASQESSLVRVAVAFPAPGVGDEVRSPAFAVLANLLGGGMSSRLFREVRERRGLAYSTGADLLRFEDVGLLSLGAAVASSSAAETVRVLRGVLEDVAVSLSEEEVATVARRMVAARRMAGESASGRMRSLGSRTLSGLPLRSASESAALLGGVDAEQVRLLATRLVCSPQAVVVVGADPSLPDLASGD